MRAGFLFLPASVTLHFWGTLSGVVVATTALLAAGAAQAAELDLGAGKVVLPHPNVVDLLRVVAVIGVGVIAAAQYVLAYNTFRTSRSGPYVDLVSRVAVATRGVA